MMHMAMSGCIITEPENSVAHCVSSNIIGIILMLQCCYYTEKVGVHGNDDNYP